MSVEILGVNISNINIAETLEQINEMLSGTTGNLIATVNPEFVLAAQKNIEFKIVLNSAAIAIADGTGIIWAGKLLKKTKLTRVTGVDLCLELLKGKCPEAKIFLLGGASGVADAVKAKYPDAWIVGAESGGELIEANWELEDNQAVVDRINKSGANLLLVAFGQVRQEMWIAKNLDKLPNIRVAIGIGGSFDFLSGKIKRAPKLLRALGLEWLYRLIKEPKRWRRIYDATIKFPLLIMKEKFK